MEKTNKVLCFTGHRIQFVKQYKREIDHYLKNKIAITKQKGANTFISGMALGVDQWAAQQVLNDPQLNLICAIPCLEHYKKWSSDSKLDWFKIILSKRSELHYVLNKPYSYSCMDARNRWMVDHKKRMGAWKLSVFRPERKRDAGEFIPLEILVYQMMWIFNIFFNSFANDS